MKKKQRSVGVHGKIEQKGTLNIITNFQTSSLIMAEQYGDLAHIILHDLFCTHLGFTAKAA